MGNAVAKIIDGLDDQVEKKKEAQDALNALMVMAEDKAKLHYQSVIDDAMDSKLVPVHKVITKMQQINCGVSRNPEGLKQNIQGSIKNFVKGEIVDGLVAIASQALDVLMGNVAGNKSEYTGYAITAGSLGGLNRVDFYMFYYKYTSTALTAVTEDCLITSLVISSVNVNDLQANDIKVIIQNQYSDYLPGETEDQLFMRQKRILELVMAGFKDLKS